MEKEIKEWLDSSGLTEEELDYMWDFCVNFGHSVISRLDKISDVDECRDSTKWRTLHIRLIQQIPDEYKKMVERVIYEKE